MDTELLHFLFSSAHLPILGSVILFMGNQGSLLWVLSLSKGSTAPGLSLWGFERKTTGPMSYESQESQREGRWQRGREQIMLSWIRSRKCGMFSNGGQQAVIEGAEIFSETVRKSRVWDKAYFGFGERRERKGKGVILELELGKSGWLFRAESWSSLNDCMGRGF